MDKKFNNLDAFLQKFKHLIPHDTKIKELVQKVIQEELQIKIEKKKIKVQGKHITLHVSPVLKQEISMRQEKILEKIQNHDNSIRIESLR